MECKPFGILSLERSYISTSLCSLVFQSKASWVNSGIARWLHSVTEEDLGERGSVLVRPAHGLGKARGMRSMSHLLHRQSDCSQCKLYHPPPVPGSHVLPWTLERQAGQNLNLVLCCLEEWSLFSTQPGCVPPCLTLYRLCQHSLFAAKGRAAFHAVLWPLRPVHIPPLHTAGAGDWAPEGSWIHKSLNKSRNPGYSPGQAPPLVQGQVLSLCKASPSVSEESSRSVDLTCTKQWI